jgi:hypothetical protein
MIRSWQEAFDSADEQPNAHVVDGSDDAGDQRPFAQLCELLSQLAGNPTVRGRSVSETRHRFRVRTEGSVQQLARFRLTLRAQLELTIQLEHGGDVGVLCIGRYVTSVSHRDSPSRFQVRVPQSCRTQ